MEFTGFPVAALDFYDDLEVDNTRSYWEKHKATYAECVKAPMTAMCEALGPEFGDAKVFRPYRDVRFAKDKTPYKTHQGAFVAAGPATGWYVEVSARGVRTGAGFYRAEPSALAAIRTAIDRKRTGAELERVLETLRSEGFTIDGEQLRTTPRGYDRDHPRIDLLRHKSLSVGKSYGFEPVIHTAELADRIRTDWRATKPLIEWLTDNS